jgi:tRNA dimethylallyltransferase
MIEEIHDLHTTEYVSWKRLESFGLEYKWCALFLQKKINKEELYDGLLQDIRRYAKRQETWIRRWEKQGALIHHVTTDAEAIALTHTFLHDKIL